MFYRNRSPIEAFRRNELPVDAMTDMRPEAHEYSLKRVFSRLGETGTTQQVIEQLDARSISK
jgi:isochorismate hydrolase